MTRILALIKVAMLHVEGLPEGTPVGDHEPMSRQAFTFFREKFMPRAKLEPKNGHLEWLDRHTTPYLLALQLTEAK